MLKRHYTKLLDTEIVSLIVESYFPEYKYYPFQNKILKVQTMEERSFNPLSNYNDLLPLLVDNHVDIRRFDSNGMIGNFYCILHKMGGDIVIQGNSRSGKEYRRIGCLALVVHSYGIDPEL